MSTPHAVAVYRALLRLYPRRFRREYGADMEALLVDQLQDGGARSVWVRTTVDLATTIPALHMEAYRMRPTRSPRAARPFSARWWKFLTVGVTYFAAISTFPGTIDDESLYLAMSITFPIAVVVTGAGLVLGAAHLGRSGGFERPAG